MKKHCISDILIFVLSAELVGAVSALLSGGFSDFFTVYAKPPLLPPAWLFPVVWAVLYALMGFSAYLVRKNGCGGRQLALYWAQLAVNFSWSIVFFRFRAIWAAFAVIALLFVLVLLMIKSFARVSRPSALINIPYILWIAFAAYLNLATAIINRPPL